MAVSLASTDLLASGELCSSFSKVGQVKHIYLTTTSTRLTKLNKKRQHGQGLNISHNICISANYRSGQGSGAGEFFAGFVLGGVVFGALGYLLGPQVSKTVSDRFREKDVPSKNLDDDEGIEKTRRNLNEKIAQLNSAIDDVSAQLQADDGFAFADGNTPELESAA